MAGKIIVGLDIGTTKIAALIAEVGAKEIKLLGVGNTPSVGLKRGIVVNIDHTVESIKKAMAQAERMAGVGTREVYVGIAGDHIRSINSTGVVAVGRGDKEITEDDVRRVIDAAKAITMPMDREIIHAIPQEFMVDAQGGIRNPLGLTGTRLEVDVHIVTGAVASAQNIFRCVKRAGYEVKDIVLEPLASSFAVLDRDEQELGVLLIDIGGGTTDMAVFFDGSIRVTDMFTFAGESVTRDVSVVLRMPHEKAEEAKKRFGCAMQSMVEADEKIEIPSVGGRAPREVSRKDMAKVIEARMVEIFEYVRASLTRNKYANVMNAGVVITGGGSLLPGAVELAGEIFKLPVRLGYPKGFGGMMDQATNPMYATGVGLIHYGIQRERGMDSGEDGDAPDDDPDMTPTDDPSLHNEEDQLIYRRIMRQMKQWTKEFF